MELCDSVMIFDNSVKNPNFVLRSLKGGSVETLDFHLFEKIKKSYHENKRGH
jgi:predicted ABC-type ATPase